MYWPGIAVTSTTFGSDVAVRDANDPYIALAERFTCVASRMPFSM